MKNSKVTNLSKFSLFLIINSMVSTLVFVYYLSGNFQTPRLLDGYYELQAHAFESGQLNIIPDFQQRFYYDAVMKNGKYYFYQGILPSILFFISKFLLGRLLASYLLVCFFLFIFFFYFQKIIVEIIDSSMAHFSLPSSIYWQISGLLLSWLFCFILPFPFDDTNWFFLRFTIYEQQIFYGVAMALPGIFYVHQGIKHGRINTIGVGIVFFAVGATARSTWLLYSGAIILYFIYYVWKYAETPQEMLQKIAIWVIPAGCILIIPIVLNVIRFGAINDFGIFYINPAIPTYLRNMIGSFSLSTKCWNFLCSLIYYFGSPKIVEALNITSKAYTGNEGTFPSFFYNNPHFLIAMICIPFALKKLYYRNKSLFSLTIIITSVMLYMIGLIAWEGTYILMRYFMEFYYFFIVFTFIIVVTIVPYRYAFIIMVLMLGFYIPSSVKAFQEFRPEIRMVIQDNGFLPVPPRSMKFSLSTLFVWDKPIWNSHRVTAKDYSQFKIYNAIGIWPDSKYKVLVANDVAALYMIPKIEQRKEEAAVLQINGLRSIFLKGYLKVFVDGELAGGFSIDPTHQTNQELKLKAVPKFAAPYQILFMFFPESETHLEAVPKHKHSFIFQEIIFKI